MLVGSDDNSHRFSGASVLSQLTPLKLADEAMETNCALNWSNSVWIFALSTPSSLAATSFARNSLRTSIVLSMPA